MQKIRTLQEACPGLDVKTDGWDETSVVQVHNNNISYLPSSEFHTRYPWGKGKLHNMQARDKHFIASLLLNENTITIILLRVTSMIL